MVQLADSSRWMEVSIAPSIGNMAYAFLVNGRNVLWFPYQGPDELKNNPVLCGIPFLGPWANRLDADAYWVNGKQYSLNSALGNVRRDEHGKPIHGVLNFSPAWKLVSAGAGPDFAHAVSRLAFWQHPELMAQFPFAQNLTMTYRLANGSLEVETVVDNYSNEPLPVALGYHPYFQLADAPRDEWRVHVAARERLVLDEFLIPTGRAEPSRAADPHVLGSGPLDDVFTDLVREPDGTAEFWVRQERAKIAVRFGPNYRVAIVFAPRDRDFLCFEPMSAVTNAFNLAHAGRYGELQSIPAGGQWRESFWITPSGF